MALSNLTSIPQIAERSDATPGLFNRSFQQIQDNFASVARYPILAGEVGVTDISYRYGDTKRFGCAGDDATDDSSALSNWAASVAAWKHLIVSKGTYKHDGGLVVGTAADVDIVVEFEAGAWLAPTSGAGLQIKGARHRLVDPRIAIQSGSGATRGIWVNNSSRNAIHRPVIWAFATPASGFACIDVWDDAYWCDILYPTIRKDTGSVDTIPIGIRFFEQSNAGRVRSGNISHCSHCVHVDGSNSIVVDGVAFEDSFSGIVPVDPTDNGNSGVIAFANRFENVTNSLDLHGLTTLVSPNQIQYFANAGDGTSNISNPNNIEYGFRSFGGVFIADTTNGKLNFGGSTPSAVIDPAGGSLTLKSNVDVILNADQDSNTNSANVSLRWQNSEKASINSLGFKIGGGTAITRHLSGSVTWDPPSLVSNSGSSTSLAVTGAVLGDTVAVGFSNELNGTMLTGYVQSSGTVGVVIYNPSDITVDLGSGTLRADCWRH